MKFELINMQLSSLGSIDLKITPKEGDLIIHEDVIYNMMKVVHFSGGQKLLVSKWKKTVSMKATVL